MKKNTALIFIAFLSLIILIFVELYSQYDVLERRLALTSTSLFTILASAALYRHFKKRQDIELPWYIFWSVAAGVWLDAIGNFLNFYTRYFWWDEVTHGTGALAVAVAIMVILYLLNQRGKIKLSFDGIGIYTISLSVLMSVFYEISEWWGDLFFATHRIGDRFDTVSDLWYDFLGPLVVVLAAALILRARRRRL